MDRIDTVKTNTDMEKETPILQLPTGTRERKIGSTTFIVSSRFKDEPKRDVVSIIARLIQNDLPPVA